MRRDKAEYDKLIRLRAAIDEGLKSGECDRTVDEIMEEIETKLKADGRL